jgi:predicted aldo/keto reductase-like oxidoreductase
MKTQAGVYWDKEKQNPINMKAALKWALQNENVHTAIPGFTSFDQLTLDISVMADLTLTPREREDLRLGKKAVLTGLYCQQCEKCLPQCGRKFDIPTLMRSYMYAHGYRNLALARETFAAVELSKVPCTDCHTCKVKCTMGFNIREKILDIARIQDIPADFLA